MHLIQESITPIETITDLENIKAVLIFENIKNHPDHHETTERPSNVPDGSADRYPLSHTSLPRSPDRSYLDVTLRQPGGHSSPEDPERLARRHEPREPMLSPDSSLRAPAIDQHIAFTPAIRNLGRRVLETRNTSESLEVNHVESRVLSESRDAAAAGDINAVNPEESLCYSNVWKHFCSSTVWRHR